MAYFTAEYEKQSAKTYEISEAHVRTREICRFSVTGKRHLQYRNLTLYFAFFHLLKCPL